jgi:predicted ArsR family transcriptional regulator
VCVTANRQGIVQDTKHQILTLLKRTGSSTVDEAAGALSIASMTARQHLVGLEKDGLVVSEKVRRANGRPHYVYRLTPKGDEKFPRRYDLLAQLLLDEIGNLEVDDVAGRSAEQRRELVIQRAADRLTDRHSSNLSGQPLRTRVAAATELLHAVGGFAEWYETVDGFEIRDYNCMFSRFVGESASDCQWHVRLLNRLLDHDVTHEVFSNGAIQCCRYVIFPGA